MKVIVFGFCFLVSIVNAQVTLPDGEFSQEMHEDVNRFNLFMGNFSSTPKFIKLLGQFANANVKCVTQELPANDEKIKKMALNNATLEEDLMFQHVMGCSFVKLLVDKTEGPIVQVEDSVLKYFKKDITTCFNDLSTKHNKDFLELGRLVEIENACGLMTTGAHLSKNTDFNVFISMMQNTIDTLIANENKKRHQL